MAHALILEGSDPGSRHKADAAFEKAGHEIRADLDPAYKRATWGRRPEDVAAQRALIAEVEGNRVR